MRAYPTPVFGIYLTNSTKRFINKRQHKSVFSSETIMN